MPAAWLERRLLIATAVTLYSAVFIAFVLFEVPGLGLGHFFYIPVALLALAGGTRFGLLGGVIAAALYALAIAVTPRLPTQDVLTLAMAIRLVTYSSCGMLIGWFANEHRRHLEQLREFADRDFLTGLLNTRVFDEVLARRCPRTSWHASAVTSSRSSSKDDWQAPRNSARSSVPTSKRRICR
jgi:K+-sensing histidine kinase KdpD